MAPSTCCGKSDQGCVCASQAKCSCGEKSALQCTCANAEVENKIAGPRCSCRARPAGSCNCERSAKENTTPAGDLCPCGARPANASLGFFIGLTIYDPLRYGSLEDLTTVPAILVNRLSALYEQLLYAWSRLSVLYAESGLHEWLTDTWTGVLGRVVSLGSIVHHSGLTPLLTVLFIIVVLHQIEAVPLPYVPRFLWVWFWNFRANFLLRYDVDQDGEATRLYVERALEPFTIPVRRFVTLLWGLICLAGSFGYHLSIFVWRVIRMATWGPFVDLTRRLWVQIQLEYDRINPWEETVEDADEEQDSDDEGENDRVDGIWNGSNERRKRNKKGGGKADQSKEAKKRNGRKAQGKGKGGRKR